MPITLGLNLSSLKTQTQLSRTSDELSNVFTRLSSGQRINKASDDAAGLAIADSLNADSRVYAQGVRNLNDGISVLNIADGALQELTNITFRLTELAEQAANGTLGSSQRASLDEEAQALKKEYLRISKTTEFNGRKLFDGQYGVLSLQAGYGTNAVLGNGLGGAIGTGEFDSAVSYAIGSLPEALITGDFNNDGHTDFISSDRSSDALYINLGTGDGGFAEAITQADTDYMSTLDSADVNNDGILDLVAVEPTNDRIAFYLGNGNGTFATATFYDMGNSTYDSKFGDFNGDGNIDIATIDLVDNNIAVHLGGGDGTFSAYGTYSVGNNPLSMEVADFNGDGLDDIVAAINSDGTINVVLANGDGSLSTATSYAAGSSPGPVIVADTNNDGIVDIIAGARGTGHIGVFLGNGDGTFQSRNSYAVGGFTEFHNLAAGDFDGDGNVDIASANNTDSTISILLGNGDGTYQQETNFSTGGQLGWLVADDLNADGVVDLAVVSDANNSVEIYNGSTTTGVAPLLDFSLSTIVDAKHALSRFQQKLTHLSEQHGQIGAFQSRIEVAEKVLKVSTENFKAAESRIRDADIAQESSQLTRLNILQQSAAAVLGQANLQPQLVLQLLGGGR